MKRYRILTILGSLLTVLLMGTAFVYWQVSRLKFSFSDEQIEQAQTLAVGAMSNAALDSSVLGDSFSREEALKPVLAQYQDDPALFQQRVLFTRTWLIAGRLAQDLVQSGSFPHAIINSNDLAHVAPGNRIDAWKNPYCVLVKDGAIVMMSSGDKGPLQCEPLQGTAEELSSSTNSAKLKRLPNDVLVTVLHVPAFVTQLPKSNKLAFESISVRIRRITHSVSQSPSSQHSEPPPTRQPQSPTKSKTQSRETEPSVWQEPQVPTQEEQTGSPSPPQPQQPHEAK